MNMTYKKAYGIVKGGKRPAGLPFSEYTKMAKSAGADDTVTAEDYDALPEAEEEDEDTGKGLSGDDLQKALADYAAVEQGLDPAGQREEELTAKHVDGTISKAEKTELAAIWTGTPAGGGEALNKSLTEALVDDEDVGNMFDASDVLKAMADSIGSRIDALGTSVLEGDHRTLELVKAQGRVARAVAENAVIQGRLLKSLAQRLGVVEATPAAPRGKTTDPRSVRQPARGATGGTEDQQFTKSEVKGALETLVIKADAAGDLGAIQTLGTATALFETSGKLPPNVEAAVRVHLGKAF